MNNLRELRELHRFYRDRPRLTGPSACFFRSDDYLRLLDAVGKDPRKLARLTLHLLANVALDPLAGTKLDQFVQLETKPRLGRESPGAEDKVWFCLQFNRLVNFIGAFQLPRHDPLTAELLTAIENNLAGHKFKAARLHRRLDKRAPQRYARYEARARRAVANFYAQEQAVRPVFTYHDGVERAAYEQGVRERAAAIRDGVLQPLMQATQQRIHAVGESAFDPRFHGSYFDILATFVATYLFPFRSALAPTA